MGSLSVMSEAAMAGKIPARHSRKAGMPTLLLLTVSLVAGSVHGLSFGAGPRAAALQFIGFVILAGIVLWLRARREWASALLCCAAFWLASDAFGLRWIAAALLARDSLGIALGGLVYCMLIVGIAGLSILCLWAATVLCAPVRNDALCCALLSSALLLGELLREALLPSFPWLAVGYAHIESPLASLLPLVGVQGVSWVAQFAALLLGALSVSLAVTRTLQISTAVLLAVVALGAVTASWIVPPLTHEAGSLRVAVMQTAIPAKDKFRASLFGRHLREIGDFAQSHDAQLVVAPETAVPTTLRALTPAQEEFLEHDVSPSRALLFGAFAEDSAGEVYNSAVLLQRVTGAAAGVQRTVYIKQHLAPIGEYAPPGFGWIAALLDIPMSNLRSTRDTPHNFQVFGITIIPSVCQDLLYGDDLRTTTAAPRVLINLSNVVFFASPLARTQFLSIARARALEQQIPVLIAANGGPTAFIDAQGAIERELPPGTPGALEVTLHPRAGTTVYARYGNSLLYWVMALAALLSLARAVLPTLWHRAAQ